MPLPNKKLEVTPNQKVVFDRTAEDMVKKVTELPKLITKLENLPQFQFKDEPVVTVFQALEKAYGIKLEYDKQILKNCTITTKLEDETLFQKLNIICMALNLKYHEKGASVIIHGDACI